MKPVPVPTAVSAPYWDATRRGLLMLQRCTRCEVVIHPPRPLCTACGAAGLAWVAASGGGCIHTVTVVHHPPSKAFASPLPYVLAIVTLDEGPRMMANVITTDPAAVHIGMRVRVTFEQRGDFSLPQVAPDV